MALTSKQEAFCLAVASAGVTPCDKFACTHREECASDKKACSAFRQFVESGRAHDPHLRFPLRLTKKQCPEWHPVIAPSRGMFRSAMAA